MAVKKIRLATNIPSLKKKIKVDSPNDFNKTMWFVRFNIPLDERTVSSKTMNITDLDGYIMSTDILYNRANNVIVISPIDSYEDDVYYLLNISKKVMSSRGKKMRTKIHILFKIVDDKISQLQTLKKGVKTPEPKPRPKNYDELRSKIYMFELPKDLPQYKLPITKMEVSFIPAIYALVGIIICFFVKNVVFNIICSTLSALSLASILSRLWLKKNRSIIAYNFGANMFNRGQYEKARTFFTVAAAIDEKNEYAEYALNKVKFYI
ncbi:MAG: tetratricopeptide repeat protein [Clostridiales bacterium]|jgi:hypothetical protein|nr:tetratricopeptide repeat protein [Clostridiales bacterium]